MAWFSASGLAIGVGMQCSDDKGCRSVDGAGQAREGGMVAALGSRYLAAWQDVCEGVPVVAREEVCKKDVPRLVHRKHSADVLGDLPRGGQGKGGSRERRERGRASGFERGRDRGREERSRRDLYVLKTA